MHWLRWGSAVEVLCSQLQPRHGSAQLSLAYLVWSCSSASRAVSGESVAEPGAFLTGANSSSRRTSSSAGRSAQGKVSKMNCSSLIPCTHLQLSSRDSSCFKCHWNQRKCCIVTAAQMGTTHVADLP